MADRESLLKIYQQQLKNKNTNGCPSFISGSTNLKKLETIQKNCLRIALGTWKLTRIFNLQIVNYWKIQT